MRCGKPEDLSAKRPLSGTGTTVDWTENTAKKAGHKVADSAKKVAKALNPVNW